jgi:hypothetical protein
MTRASLYISIAIMALSVVVLVTVMAVKILADHDADRAMPVHTTTNCGD